MVRSLENFPELAPFRIALRSHRIGVQSGDPVQGRAVGGEVRQVHAVVAVYQAPFIMKFTLLVPLAGYRAVCHFVPNGRYRRAVPSRSAAIRMTARSKRL